MKRPLLIVLAITSVFLFACQTQRKLYKLYEMDEFNIDSGNLFVRQIQNLPTINEISIIDTKADGNDFIVNRQSVFLDTVQQDKPNYYSVRKRAKELNVHSDSLTNCIKTFYKIGVNDFNRDSNYFRFGVVVGLTINKGYLFLKNINSKVGDTLPATSVASRSYHFKVVLTKQVDKNWFEFYETE